MQYQIDSSLSLGYFPDSWKTSLISMILKSEKPSSAPGSYRPISLLPSLGKLLERIMVIRITEYMVKKNLLNHFQAGFRKNKSCVHQLLRLSEHVSKWFSKRSGARTVGLFIDAEKAFDSIWLDGLRKQLYDAKIHVQIVRWLSSFLHNRHGHVKVNLSVSEMVPLMAGVPQGSILAPLLYIFYVKDMPSY